MTLQDQKIKLKNILGLLMAPLKEGKSLFICGMMGAGKTHVLKILENELSSKDRAQNFNFFDLDEYIQKYEGKSIAQIMNKSKDILTFRKLEYKALLSLLSSQKQDQVLIISLGGGTLDYLPSFNLLMDSHFLGFWLNESVQTCWTRVLGDKNRPLVTNFQDFKSLYEKRVVIYKKFPPLL